jgi:hypothetical protein
LKLVYTHPSIIDVFQAKSVVEFAGIKCVLRNEYAVGAIGELAPIDAWPEVWVMNDKDFERASFLIKESQATTQEADWSCTGCANPNPAAFESCWHCGKDRPLK